jgi:hypothetical protein
LLGFLLADYPERQLDLTTSVNRDGAERVFEAMM